MIRQFINDTRQIVDSTINRAEEAHVDIINQVWAGIDDLAAGQGMKLGLAKNRAAAAGEFYNMLRTAGTVSGELAGSLASDQAEKNLKLLQELVDYRLKWDELDIDYMPYEATFKTGVPITTARQAALSIADGSTVFTTGFGAHARCSIFFRAIRETFKKERGPHSLTWLGVSGQGGRGKAPATIEELGQVGILKEYICGHIETAKALLKLGQSGDLDIHTLPQGVYTFLIEEQSKNGVGPDGRSHLLSSTGLNTFMDPRHGTGSAVTPGDSKYVRFDDKTGQLEYSLPKIDVALLSVPYVDVDGNVYFKDASCLTECLDAARAAKKIGGRVIVTTGRIIPKNEAEISIPASDIDALVFNPKHEQLAGVLMDNFWPMFTANRKSDADIDQGLQTIRLINSIMGITPRRRAVDNALARLAGQLFVKHTKPGSLINLGVGLPEEVGRLLYESGLHQDLTFTTESGAYGGIPAPGIFFGGAINPQRLESSTWMFHEYQKNLAITVLGFLQVDSQGNVNVSKRGPKVTDSIGPGGFMDIADCASTIIFMGSWTVHGKTAARQGQVRIQQAGRAKFVEQVDQVTFSGQAALGAGKTVYYVTDVGMFQLTSAGLTLQAIWPGINVEQDVLAVAKAQVILPAQGPEVLDRALVSGDNFRLSWPTATIADGKVKKGTPKNSAGPSIESNGQKSPAETSQAVKGA